MNRKNTIIVLVSSMLISCTHNIKSQPIVEQSPLSKEIEVCQQELPIALSYGVITNISFNGNDVVVLIGVDEDEMTIDYLQSHLDYMKSSTINMIRLANSPQTSLNDAMTTLMKLVVEENVGLIFRHKGLASQRIVEMRLSSKEIKDAMLSENKSTRTSDSYLDALIVQYQKGLPIEVDEGWYMTSIERTTNFIRFNYTLNSSLYDLKKLEKTLRGEGIDFLNNLRSENNALEGFFRLIKNAGLGVSFRYSAKDTKRYFEVSFDVSEL